MRDNNTESVDEAFLGVVEVWQSDWEVKDVDELVRLILDCFGQINEVLVHHKGLLRIALAQTREPFEDLGDMCVVDPVDFHEVLEQHEDHIGEKARLLAEVSMLEKIKDLC